MLVCLWPSKGEKLASLHACRIPEHANEDGGTFSYPIDNPAEGKPIRWEVKKNAVKDGRIIPNSIVRIVESVIWVFAAEDGIINDQLTVFTESTVARASEGAQVISNEKSFALIKLNFGDDAVFQFGEGEERKFHTVSWSGRRWIAVDDVFCPRWGSLMDRAKRPRELSQCPDALTETAWVRFSEIHTTV